MDLFENVEKHRAQPDLTVCLQDRRRLRGIDDLRGEPVKGRAQARRGWDLFVGGLVQPPLHLADQRVGWLDQRQETLEIICLGPGIISRVRATLSERVQKIPQTANDAPQQFFFLLIADNAWRD
jgi:hypothetical protein